MKKSLLFQYAIIWTPTEKQYKEEGKKPKLIVELTTILADSQAAAQMQAAMEIPQDYKVQLDQIEIVLRPF